MIRLEVLKLLRTVAIGVAVVGVAVIAHIDGGLSVNAFVEAFR